MQIEHTPEHTALVTQYIELHDAWLARTWTKDIPTCEEVAQLQEAEARMLELSKRFTAAQWKELFTRRD